MAESIVTATETKIESAKTTMPTIESYEALAGEALGRIGKTSLTITKNGYLLGLLVVYSLLMTDGIQKWHLAATANREVVRWCVTLPMLIGLAMVRDLRQIKNFAGIGFCACFLQCALLGVGATLDLFQPGFVWPKHDLARGGVLNVGTAMATCLFSCESVVTVVPSVRSQMKDHEQLPLALRTALAIVISVYLVVMSLCYLAFGQGLNGNALDNITIDCWGAQCYLGSLVGFALLVNFMISIPTVAFFVISVFESIGRWRVCTSMSPSNIAFRVALMVSLVLVGMQVPHVREVIGIISASFGGCNALVFPRLMYFSLEKRCSADPSRDVAFSGRWDILRHIAVFLVAMIAMPFGFTGAIQNLMAVMSAR
jgi:hypothetical protein